MRLYKEVLIETAEQGEKLPEGAIVWTERPYGFRFNYMTVGKSGVRWDGDALDEGDTVHALVPIEAEEETTTIHDYGDLDTPYRRFTTRWEAS